MLPALWRRSFGMRAMHTRNEQIASECRLEKVWPNVGSMTKHDRAMRVSASVRSFGLFVVWRSKMETIFLGGHAPRIPSLFVGAIKTKTMFPWVFFKTHDTKLNPRAHKN
jgi:hypothetical protein